MYYKQLPQTDLHLNRLNYRLPDHTKVLYGSGQVKKYWQPRVQRASSAWIEIEKLSLLEGLRNSILVYVHDWTQTKQWADENNLIIVPLKSSAGTSSYSSYGNDSTGNVWRCAIVNSPSVAAQWMDAWTDNDDRRIGELLGYPECCRDFFFKYWVQQDYRDLTAPAYYNSGVETPPESNILGRWTGIRLVSHMPCSFDCKHSEKIGKDHAELGRRNGFEEEVDIIYQLLNMPYKYSSLHGIAEITTPIFKVSAASEPYATEVVFERPGTNPEMSSSGKSFPFTNQAKRLVTESPSFKRAVDHYKQTNLDLQLNERPDLNGFSSAQAQINAHAPIVNMFPEGAQSVVDYGCGNGALVKKLQMINILEAKDCRGIDTNLEAIDFGKRKYALRLFSGDMFAGVNLLADVAIFMDGRLEEVEYDENVGAFIDHLGTFKWLIIYRYSDWIEKKIALHNDYLELIQGDYTCVDEEKTDTTWARLYQKIPR